MLAKSGQAIDELLDDTRAGPSLAHGTFANAVLTLAHKGIKMVRRT